MKTTAKLFRTSTTNFILVISCMHSCYTFIGLNRINHFKVETEFIVLQQSLITLGLLGSKLYFWDLVPCWHVNDCRHAA